MFATLLSVPPMIGPVPLETTDVITGKFWKLFGPAVAVAWLWVTPSSPRSIPRSPLLKIRFERIELPVVVAPTTSTPLSRLNAIELPAPVAVPPTELFDAPWVISTPSISLPSGSLPVMSVPMKFPWTTLFVAVAPVMITPQWLAEIRFRAAANVPPTVLPGADSIETPAWELPRARVPALSVPMKLPCKDVPGGRGRDADDHHTLVIARDHLRAVGVPGDQCCSTRCRSARLRARCPGRTRPTSRCRSGCPSPGSRSRRPRRSERPGGCRRSRSQGRPRCWPRRWRHLLARVPQDRSPTRGQADDVVRNGVAGGRGPRDQHANSLVGRDHVLLSAGRAADDVVGGILDQDAVRRNSPDYPGRRGCHRREPSR